MRLVRVAIAMLVLVLISRSGSFLFRRGQRDEEKRQQAFSALFEVTSIALETAAELKPEWTEQWRQRTQRELPPKYQPNQFLHPGAVAAAYDTRFGTALLHRNRWSSKIQPLFDDLDRNAWSRVRATVERTSPALLTVRERHRESFREEELSWIDRAVEGLDETRFYLRQAERREIPESELVAQTTYRFIYVSVQLTDRLLERLRQDAAEA